MRRAAVRRFDVGDIAIVASRSRPLASVLNRTSYGGRRRSADHRAMSSTVEGSSVERLMQRPGLNSGTTIMSVRTSASARRATLSIWMRLTPGGGAVWHSNDTSMCAAFSSYVKKAEKTVMQSKRWNISGPTVVFGMSRASLSMNSRSSASNIKEN
jgi:hypothetical protein